ncbi:phytoene/squalene synthase family protein [Rhodococcus sp. D2-41]|uniref:phytoene/squalene synthase family protein n=1 Tax=Speluncibacter jeojiensis TaxID=2710754 RepID=UPI00240F83D9|nr:phytoene/squalene synthase family protein [Rhodococcus sp. D2-41]MDG3011978.1 phytoene/squalene synthase family protein [Rhodococcus sp. D2-41]
MTDLDVPVDAPPVLAPTQVSASYEHCRAVTAYHGRSYYLATRLLPAERRPAVYALYAFARSVDDLVDRPTADDLGLTAALCRTEQRLRGALAGGSAPGPVLPALVDTVARYRIDPEYFWAFLQSMRMDVPGSPEHVFEYESMEQLSRYMYGSASVIGLQLLPVLGTDLPGDPGALMPAAALGEAFQLTNFLRDVGEDLDRGRIYLPADELAAFGVDGDLLRHCRRTGHVDPRVARALAHLIARTRALYRNAEPGIGLLDRCARPCVRTAFTVYSLILDEIESSGYQVFTGRAVVPTRRRLGVAGAQLLRAGLGRA